MSDKPQIQGDGYDVPSNLQQESLAPGTDLQKIDSKMRGSALTVAARHIHAMELTTVGQHGQNPPADVINTQEKRIENSTAREPPTNPSDALQKLVGEHSHQTFANGLDIKRGTDGRYDINEPGAVSYKISADGKSIIREDNAASLGTVSTSKDGQVILDLKGEHPPKTIRIGKDGSVSTSIPEATGERQINYPAHGKWRSTVQQENGRAVETLDQLKLKPGEKIQAADGSTISFENGALKIKRGFIERIADLQGHLVYRDIETRRQRERTTFDAREEPGSNKNTMLYTFPDNSVLGISTAANSPDKISLRLPEHNGSTVEVSGYDGKVENAIIKATRPSLGHFAEAPIYQDDLNHVFGHGQSELVRHHNQANDLPIRAMLAGKKSVFINVDGHSDASKDPVPLEKENIGNWVNAVLQHPEITDFYWVLPSNFKEDEVLAEHFYNGRNTNANLSNSSPDLTIYINKHNGEMSWGKPPKDYNANNSQDYRTVNFRKRTLNELPDMTGQNVLLTTDLDYFDNDNSDTVRNAKVPWQGQQGFADYVRILRAKGVRPFLHVISESPDYTRSEHHNELMKFAYAACDASTNGGDINIANYRNRAVQKEAHYNGVTIPRSANPEYELLHHLSSMDARTTQADQAIVIDTPNDEYSAAIAKTMKIYKVDRPAAEQILQGLDAEDGRVDGIIFPQIIEQDIISKAIKKN